MSKITRVFPFCACSRLITFTERKKLKYQPISFATKKKTTFDDHSFHIILIMEQLVSHFAQPTDLDVITSVEFNRHFTKT